MIDDMRFPGRERPHNLSIGDQLWETALQNYADRELQQKIRKAKGFGDAKVLVASYQYPPRDMSRHVSAVRENSIHFLIRGAAKYLYAQNADRISAYGIAELLTTDRFSIDPKTVAGCLQKYPYLVEYYSLFRRSYEEINKRYGEAILELWNENQRQPRLFEIAKRLGLKGNTVGDKLRGRGRSKSPPWLIQLFEHGPGSDPNTKT